MQIEKVEVHPTYRRRGLCGSFVKHVFDALERFGLSTIMIYNAAKQPGHKCYTGAAKAADWNSQVPTGSSQTIVTRCASTSFILLNNAVAVKSATWSRSTSPAASGRTFPVKLFHFSIFSLPVCGSVEMDLPTEMWQTLIKVSIEKYNWLQSQERIYKRQKQEQRALRAI